MNTPLTAKNPTARDEDNAILLQGEIRDALCSELGLKDQFAQPWALLITNYLRQRLGAQQVYIPAPSRTERDAAIFREYNGSNAGDVCQRHNISRRRMHEICTEQRSLNAVSCLKTAFLAS